MNHTHSEYYNWRVGSENCDRQNRRCLHVPLFNSILSVTHVTPGQITELQLDCKRKVCNKENRLVTCLLHHRVHNKALPHSLNIYHVRSKYYEHSILLSNMNSNLILRKVYLKEIGGGGGGARPQKRRSGHLHTEPIFM
jgi:hypothetical protein